MHDARNLTADIRFDSEFLLEFATHGIARLFAFLDLASRKLPFEWHRLVPRPLAGEEEIIFHDQRCYHSFHDLHKESGDARQWGASLSFLQSFADEFSAIFDQFAVFFTKSREEMAINIEFSCYFTFYEDRNHNLRFCFQRACQITWILLDVVDHHRLA